jgi:hypothetical protein
MPNSMTTRSLAASPVFPYGRIPAQAHGAPTKVEKRWVKLSGRLIGTIRSKLLRTSLGGYWGRLRHEFDCCSQAGRPGNIRNRVDEAFRRSGELGSANITIAFDGGRVTLSGRLRHGVSAMSPKTSPGPCRALPKWWTNSPPVSETHGGMKSPRLLGLFCNPRSKQ